MNVGVTKYVKNQKSTFLKKVNKSVLSQMTFYLEYNENKPVGFFEETISFTCELVKI